MAKKKFRTDFSTKDLASITQYREKILQLLLQEKEQKKLASVISLWLKPLSKK